MDEEIRLIWPQLYALSWGSVQCVVMTRPTSLSNADFLGMGEALWQAVGEDGTLWLWGKVDGLSAIGWEITSGLYDYNLWLCWKQRRTLPGGSPLPFVGDRFAREMPPAIMEYAIATSTNPGDLVLDVCNRSGVVAALCEGTDRRCLVLGSTLSTSLVIPPSGGWPQRPELTDAEVIRRFEAKLIPDEQHLLWAGAKTKGGYGHFKSNGQNFYAHRFQWERTFGPITTPSIDVSHSCGVRLCCKLDHLRVAHHLDNLEERRIRERHRDDGST